VAIAGIHLCRRWRCLIFGSRRHHETRKRQQITSLLDSSTATAYLKSTSIAIFILCNLKTSVRRCRCHSQSLRASPCHLKACRPGRFFPIHSRVDLRHVCDTVLLLVCHSISGITDTHLVHLCLRSIPRDDGHQSLKLEFKFPQSPHPDLKSRPPFPQTRSVLPTLAIFCFKGLNEYMGLICGPDGCTSTSPVVDNVLQ
jgi:hypothetical protein